MNESMNESMNQGQGLSIDSPSHGVKLLCFSSSLHTVEQLTRRCKETLFANSCIYFHISIDNFFLVQKVITLKVQ